MRFSAREYTPKGYLGSIVRVGSGIIRGCPRFETTYTVHSTDDQQNAFKQIFGLSQKPVNPVMGPPTSATPAQMQPTSSAQQPADAAGAQNPPPQPESKKKRGFFGRLFGGAKKDEQQQQFQ